MFVCWHLENLPLSSKLAIGLAGGFVTAMNTPGGAQLLVKWVGRIWIVYGSIFVVFVIKICEADVFSGRC